MLNKSFTSKAFSPVSPNNGKRLIQGISHELDSDGCPTVLQFDLHSGARQGRATTPELGDAINWAIQQCKERGYPVRRIVIGLEWVPTDCHAEWLAVTHWEHAAMAEVVFVTESDGFSICQNSQHLPSRLPAWKEARTVTDDEGRRIMVRQAVNSHICAYHPENRPGDWDFITMHELIGWGFDFGSQIGASFSDDFWP